MIPAMSWRDAFGQLARTIDTVFPAEADLDALFAAGRPLRVKYGLDITSTSVTIGIEIGLMVLGRFQALGHTPVLILGDLPRQRGPPVTKLTARLRAGRPMTAPSCRPHV